MDEKQGTTISVMEMGQMLGLKKTDAYWLVHKQCFETVTVGGKMRIVLKSFEHWYANQVKHRKIDGTPPGQELRANSYSIKEMAEELGVALRCVVPDAEPVQNTGRPREGCGT